MKAPYKDFMNQFQSARHDIARMPDWMQGSMRMATLTFPPTKSPAGTAPKPAPRKRKP